MTESGRLSCWLRIRRRPHVGSVPTLAAIPVEVAAHPRRNRAWQRFKRFKPGVAGLIFVIGLILLAIFAPLVAPYDPTEVHTRLRGAPPSAEFRLGNDSIGRDVLSRLIYGSRVALTVGFGAISIAVTIGVTIGSAAGYFGGRLDQVLSRIVDTLMAFPTLALLITLNAVLGGSLLTVVVIIGITEWAAYARVSRAEVLSLREREFVSAARGIGATNGRIIARHVLPNMVGPLSSWPVSISAASSSWSRRSPSSVWASSRRRRRGAACWRTVVRLFVPTRTSPSCQGWQSRCPCSRSISSATVSVMRSTLGDGTDRGRQRESMRRTAATGPGLMLARVDRVSHAADRDHVNSLRRHRCGSPSEKSPTRPIPSVPG